VQLALFEVLAELGISGLALGRRHDGSRKSQDPARHSGVNAALELWCKMLHPTEQGELLIGHVWPRTKALDWRQPPGLIGSMTQAPISSNAAGR
jgi:hypothetical protein